ncbi:unnamed protein product [[Candida] boidinii]|nr:unnamed protein product [[Candida] boidinii]
MSKNDPLSHEQTPVTTPSITTQQSQKVQTTSPSKLQSFKLRSTPSSNANTNSLPITTTPQRQNRYTGLSASSTAFLQDSKPMRKISSNTKNQITNDTIQFATLSPQSYSYATMSPNSLNLRLKVLKRSLEILIERPDLISSMSTTNSFVQTPSTDIFTPPVLSSNNSILSMNTITGSNNTNNNTNNNNNNNNHHQLYSVVNGSNSSFSTPNSPILSGNNSRRNSNTATTVNLMDKVIKMERKASTVALSQILQKSVSAAENSSPVTPLSLSPLNTHASLSGLTNTSNNNNNTSNNVNTSDNILFTQGQSPSQSHSPIFPKQLNTRQMPKFTRHISRSSSVTIKILPTI